MPNYIAAAAVLNGVAALAGSGDKHILTAACNSVHAAVDHIPDSLWHRFSYYRPKTPDAKRRASSETREDERDRARRARQRREDELYSEYTHPRRRHGEHRRARSVGADRSRGKSRFDETPPEPVNPPFQARPAQQSYAPFQAPFVQQTYAPLQAPFVQQTHGHPQAPFVQHAYPNFQGPPAQQVDPRFQVPFVQQGRPQFQAPPAQQAPFVQQTTCQSHEIPLEQMYPPPPILRDRTTQIYQYDPRHSIGRPANCVNDTRFAVVSSSYPTVLWLLLTVLAARLRSCSFIR